MVKRAMNRAPGPNDNWWSQHQNTCGGTYTKVKEPENMDVKRLLINGKRKSLKSKANQVSNLHFPKSQKKKMYQVLRVLGAQKIRVPIVVEVPKEIYLVLVVQ